MHKPRIGVLRGGPSTEYDVSLNSGAAVLGALRKHLDHLYQARDILIDKKGSWHLDGVAFPAHDIASKIDVAFNALHGAYGEDGKIQAFLEAHRMPFTGSGSLASAVGMNKILTKKVLANHGIRSPYWTELPSRRVQQDIDDAARGLFSSFVFPAVIKPVSSGSSVGVSVVQTYDELHAALGLAAQHGDTILVEEYIPGIEATCGVIEGFRGHEIYSLPPIEIRPHSGFFDYGAKYQGKSDEIVPATFSQSIKKALEDLSARIHRLLGLKQYSRSDFIIHPRRGIYVLEVNTLPGLTDESLMPKALRAVGSDLHELVGHLVARALIERSVVIEHHR